MGILPMVLNLRIKTTCVQGPHCVGTWGGRLLSMYRHNFTFLLLYFSLFLYFLCNISVPVFLPMDLKSEINKKTKFNSIIYQFKC